MNPHERRELPPCSADEASSASIVMAGNRGSIPWEEICRQQEGEEGSNDDASVHFDDFVKGGDEEAERMFNNDGAPFHCLSTRFEGVNYRVSMLIGFAGLSTKEYVTIYNPSYWNKLTHPKSEGESEEEKKSRTDGRWLLSFIKALEHTKRTNGMLVQPVQTDHKNGKYSDMQVAEKKMAEDKGIPVVEFPFKGTEVSMMNTKGKIERRRDETAFLKRLEDFLLKH